MTTTIAVLAAGLLAGVVLGITSALRGPRATSAPEAAEHWLVARLSHVPRLAGALTRADRRLVGGAALAASFAAVLAASVCVGYLLDTLDAGQGFARWDDAVAEWGSSVATGTSTDALALVTELGATLPLAVLLCAVAAFDYARRRRGAVPLFLAVVGIGTILTSNGLKLLVMRERPPVDHLVGSAGSSFPSGHTAAAAACWAAIALVLATHVGRRHRPVLGGAAAGIAVSVAASRALLGVHWLTDVIAGLVVGWTWFFVSAIAFGGRIVRLGEPVVELAAPVGARREEWS